MQIYSKQDWLLNKVEELEFLIDSCQSQDEINLVFSLLDRFYYLSSLAYNNILNRAADYIVDESGFTEDRTQIVSLTYDRGADSGQSVLQSLKIPIQRKGWRNVEESNKFGDSIRVCTKKGRNQIILVDEFLGSGKTLQGRIEYLRKNLRCQFDVKCCYLVGIDYYIEKAKKDLNVEINCMLPLKRGITDFYQGLDLISAENAMLEMELRLKPWIKKKELYMYSFGYGQAEALYSLEGCAGNTPNSVFPIFWWPIDSSDKERKTILFRAEKGF